MLAPVHPAITRSDYEGMPEGPPYFQLIEGELVMSPSPATRHQRAIMRLSFPLHHFVADNKLGEVFLAPLDVFLNEFNVYQPDIAYLSAARAGLAVENGIEGPPDLCIEVLSKSTERHDKVIKKKIFAQAGVREYWLVDLAARTVTVYDLATDPNTPVNVFNSADTLKSALLPGFELELAQIFSGL